MSSKMVSSPGQETLEAVANDSSDLADARSAPSADATDRSKSREPGLRDGAQAWLANLEGFPKFLVALVPAATPAVTFGIITALTGKMTEAEALMVALVGTFGGIIGIALEQFRDHRTVTENPVPVYESEPDAWKAGLLLVFGLLLMAVAVVVASARPGLEAALPVFLAELLLLAGLYRLYLIPIRERRADAAFASLPPEDQAFVSASVTAAREKQSLERTHHRAALTVTLTKPAVVEASGLEFWVVGGFRYIRLSKVHVDSARANALIEAAAPLADEDGSMASVCVLLFDGTTTNDAVNALAERSISLIII